MSHLAGLTEDGDCSDMRLDSPCFRQPAQRSRFMPSPCPFDLHRIMLPATTQA